MTPSLQRFSQRGVKRSRESNLLFSRSMPFVLNDAYDYTINVPPQLHRGELRNGMVITRQNVCDILADLGLGPRKRVCRPVLDCEVADMIAACEQILQEVHQRHPVQELLDLMRAA